MGLKQQMFFIIISIITFLFIIRKIQKNHLNIEQAISWILWSIALLIVSIFPDIAAFLARMLGFISTSNFIFSMFIFFLYIMLFSQTITISKMKERELEMIQKLSIEEYKNKKKGE